MKTTEQIRLEEARAQKTPWKKWGPYLSERQWGTIREDYGQDGTRIQRAGTRLPVDPAHLSGARLSSQSPEPRVVLGPAITCG